MRLNRNTLLGTALTAGLFLSNCAGDDGSAEKEPEPPKTGVEEKGSELEGVQLDEGWQLESVTNVGESEILAGYDDSNEASLFRFNLKLGDTAVSCLVVIDSDIDFPSSGAIDPTLCFIDGDPLQPLVQATPGSR